MSAALTPWRPSNATEGDAFFAGFCRRCTRRGPSHGWSRCDIEQRALLHDTDDPEYPGEWVETDDGPACTAFAERVRPCVRRNRAAARRAGQADMFGAAP